MKKSLALLAVLALVFVSVFAFAGPAAADNHESRSVVDVALEINAATGEFSTLISAAACTNLVKPLDSKPGVTVFAPTDAAFAELGLNADNICELPRKDLSNISVTPAIADKTTTGLRDRLLMIISATFLMPSALFTEVPPNFIIIIFDSDSCL